MVSRSLSQAVVLWRLGEKTGALEKLAQVHQKKRPNVVRLEDLRYDQFWREKVLTTLEAMLALPEEKTVKLGEWSANLGLLARLALHSLKFLKVIFLCFG